ncbi:hypothetical protein J7J47_03670 [Halomonas sp. ISL-60]|uniref:hypothetical protein n=1 Tax=Halomonas sp. ISL-56 TaxID=2819149 RepID=UPI001BE5D684|nr:hypothetical protein [Halomonas sp. ISL-56]MBT2771328.1 hypothetical protein [Halomonas sp. ISL-60]MBT2800685.1 hypothetical protein [Halomonas sp. ISL-56]
MVDNSELLAQLVAAQTELTIVIKDQTRAIDELVRLIDEQNVMLTNQDNEDEVKSKEIKLMDGTVLKV